MGSLQTGHVVTQEPAPETLSALTDLGLSWAVYRATDQAIWVIDVFAADKENHWPFASLPPRTTETSEYHEQNSNLLEVFKRLKSQKISIPISPSLQICFLLSTRMNTPVFSFMSDDDTTQATFNCNQGSLQSMCVDCEEILLTCQPDQIQISPVISDEYPSRAAQLGELLKGLADVTQEVDEPCWRGQLHGIALTNWPDDAGDPRSFLGLGDWNGLWEAPNPLVLAETSSDSLPKNAVFRMEPKTESANTETTAPSAKPSFWKRLFGGV